MEVKHVHKNKSKLEMLVKIEILVTAETYKSLQGKSLRFLKSTNGPGKSRCK